MRYHTQNKWLMLVNRASYALSSAWCHSAIVTIFLNLKADQSGLWQLRRVNTSFLGKSMPSSEQTCNQNIKWLHSVRTHKSSLWGSLKGLICVKTPRSLIKICRCWPCIKTAGQLVIFCQLLQRFKSTETGGKGNDIDVRFLSHVFIIHTKPVRQMLLFLKNT